jgi:deoxyribonuclease V
MQARRAWPRSAQELLEVQAELGRASPVGWVAPDGPYAIGACFVCFTRGQSGRGAAGEPGWAGAAVTVGERLVSAAVVSGTAGAPYAPGLLALREGPLLEAAVRALPVPPDALLVNATGRDHPRRAGLAVHVGAVVGVPSVGVTHRPLLADARVPAEVSFPVPSEVDAQVPAKVSVRTPSEVGARMSGEVGARVPLVIGTEVVACWLRNRPNARALVVHPGWRTDLDTACAVVLAATGRVRAPVPLREARRLARRARAGGGGGRGGGGGGCGHQVVP